MSERQQVYRERFRTGGQLRFVLVAGLAWFAVFGLLPLSFVLARALTPGIVTVLFGFVLIAGLFVGDVAWHFLECSRPERVGDAGVRSLAGRRRTLLGFMAVPCVTSLAAVPIGIALPGPVGIAGLFGAMLVALIALERSMKRAI